MISPDFRATEPTNLLQGFQYYISSNHGDGLFKDMEPDFQRCALVRKEICDALYHRTDAEQLSKFKDLFLENYKTHTLFNKYFTYGNQKNQVNVTYTWFDSFSKQKKQAMSPTLDAISSLYNYAVACARIGCYRDLSGEGIKEASKMFQQAGWVFEHLKTLVTQLQPTEVTCDFNSETLGCLSALMLAQAQYLFYKKALDHGMKAQVLSKTAMQVSDYFKKAYELSQVNPGVKNYDNSKFTNILQYHTYYFEAMAYNVIATEEYKKAGDQGKGMGLAVAYFRKVNAILEKAKPVVQTIPANYLENFNAKVNDIKLVMEKAMKDNKTVYFEKEPADVPRPDMQNFVKLEPVFEDLNTKLNLEDKLRHIVPPPVRGMQEELKNILQEMINQQYEIQNKADNEQKHFLQSHGLPQALHAVTATNEIPGPMWQKIEEYQKRGGVQCIEGMVQGIQSLKGNNRTLIQQMKSVLDEEEVSDNQLRQQHAAKWSRLPSNSLNIQFRQSIQDYENKLNQADSTDGQIESKLKTNAEAYKLIAKTKNELSQMIPQTSDQSQYANSPVVQTLKKSLEDLDILIEERGKINDQAVQKIQNFNAIEELMMVHTGQKQKHDVFEKHRKEFQAIFVHIEDLHKRRAEINATIQQNISAFSQILAQLQNDPTKTQFFQSIDQAITAFNELQNMLHQGSQFYIRLGDILNKLYQNIMDFKMSRDIEKNDLVYKMGGFQNTSNQPQPPPGQLPNYGQPQYPGPGQNPPPYSGQGAPNQQQHNQYQVSAPNQHQYQGAPNQQQYQGGQPPYQQQQFNMPPPNQMQMPNYGQQNQGQPQYQPYGQGGQPGNNPYQKPPYQ